MKGFYEKNKLSIEKIIELEKLIPNINTSIENLYKDYEYNYDEIIYLVRAILLPKDEFTKLIEYRDSNKNSLNHWIFINEIAKNYKTNEKNILLRIQEIREINRYLEDRTLKKVKILSKNDN